MAAVQLLSAARDAMSYLVYCILGADGQEPQRKLRFLGYPRASISARTGELAAVTSETSSADLAPDVARLLAYSKVVEWYNRERTVIPMRYGCIMDTLPEVSRLLENHQREYLQLLAQLDGHVEMSARVILAEPRTLAGPCGNHPLPVMAQFAADHDGRSGIAYLAERSKYYASREDHDQRREDIRREICSHAQGTFVRCAKEYAEHAEKGVLVIHFLVSRHRVDQFRAALKPLAAERGAVAVTGPWPPYNFARP